ncbi:hypothetical protein CDAR_506601 [Caerostris darwini]|uniref:Major facilitator superfamily associated domain-containing protein n=1 Tax=Caerostris darwini TaxID=1538125 RepID=A0AAV4QBU7_9ARAC|nr:hypothetical protein CDAR_506601 [Caerostris darwini]
MELQKVEKGFRSNPPELTVVTANPRERDNVSNRFTFTILKCFTISIYKPLVTLKLALLLYFSAGAALMTFYIVYLKQIGLTIQEIFLMHSIIPLIQATCTAIFAVISDKFGKAKILLILNLIITGASIAALNYVPVVISPECNNQSVVLHYDPENATWISNMSLCEKNETEIYIDACHTACLNESSDIKSKGGSNISQPETKNLPCTTSVTFHNLQMKNELCPVSFNSSQIEDAFQCHNGCNISCTKANTIKCAVGVEGRKVLVVIYIIIITIFLTTYVNSYRFLDITSMILVKEHHVEYGLVRLWAVLGVLIGPPMAGLVVELASVPGGKANYAATFYLFAVVCLLTAAMVYKVDVRSLGHSTELWKKTVVFAKSIDVLFFYIVLFLMGLSWGFRHFYKNWFLAELNTSVVLLSVIEAAQSLYGVPFLLKSEWIVGKLGETRVFVLAFIAYGISFLGYSVLQTAWPAILIEVTTVVNYQLFWVAVIKYCILITPDSIVAIVNSTAGSIHFTIGRITGGFFGGFLMSSFSSRSAFRIIGIINFASAILCGIYWYFRRRHGNERKQWKT